MAIVSSDQGFPHWILSGIGFVATLDATQRHVFDRASAVARALGLAPDVTLSQGVALLMADLGPPSILGQLGYRASAVDALAKAAPREPLQCFRALASVRARVPCRAKALAQSAVIFASVTTFCHRARSLWMSEAS